MSEFDAGDIARDGNDVAVSIRVPSDLRYLEGHFPGDPIVPGVAQVVALAEAQARRAWPELAFAIGVKRLKFMEALRPGDELSLALSLDRDALRVGFTIRRDDADCSRGTLLFR